MTTLDIIRESGLLEDRVTTTTTPDESKEVKRFDS